MADARDGDGATKPRRGWWWIDYVGAALGILLAVLSTTPSLLSRTPLNQGLLTGLAFGVGYMIGALISTIARRWIPAPGRRVARIAWAVLGAATVAVAVLMVPAFRRTQDQLRDRVGVAHLTVTDLLVALGVAVGTAAALLLAGKGLAALQRRMALGFTRRRDAEATRATGGAAALGITIIAAGLVVLGAVGVGGFALYTEYSYRDYNASFSEYVKEPSGVYRSVGEQSALSWENAGREGRNILGRGPNAHDISTVTGAPAVEPIRVYVGLDEPGGWDEHAAAAVGELERLHADERSVLVVAATTGTGWLDPQAIDAVEYLNHGDTALVAVQYTVAESWQSFAFHPGAYRESTAALVSAVHEWWSALPEDDRPRLILYGLSLGSRAMQESFADAESLRAAGDGAVLAGTPYGTAINADLTARRDEGSPVGVPVLDAGQQFRWFADGLDVSSSSGTWDQPRVAFLQHADDPIVWIGLPIVWSEPEWLREGQRSAEISPEMRWYPIVTGLQGMFDTAVDLDGPDGDGHRYGSTTLEAWVAVASAEDLAPDAVDAVRQRIVGEDLPAGGDV